MPALTEDLRLGRDDGADDGVRLGLPVPVFRQLDRAHQVGAVDLRAGERPHYTSIGIAAPPFMGSS